jgi:3-dehydroquinate synthase
MRLRVEVRFGTQAHPVLIDTHGAALVAGWLARSRRRWVVVTDARVARRVWPEIARALRRRGLDPAPPIVLRGGERRKNLSGYAALQCALLQRGVERDDRVVAVGGGVVTDLAGFAAATYRRGVDWVAVPTTLLGMVDAAIGGKVGANLLGTKNAVGAFHPPRAVLVGTDWLRSLSARARRSGLGEVVKYAMIADRRLFLQLERTAQEVLASRPAADARLVARCCRIKARFVGTDPRDQGIRAALNFGHTVGHALEGDGKSGLEHGEAVGLGMLAACALAEDLGVAREPLVARLRTVMLQLGLPVRLGARPATGVLRRRWRRDKKVRQGSVHVVLTPRIGEARVGVPVEERDLVRALARILPPPRRAGSR